MSTAEECRHLPRTDRVRYSVGPRTRPHGLADRCRHSGNEELCRWDSSGCFPVALRCLLPRQRSIEWLRKWILNALPGMRGTARLGMQRSAGLFGCTDDLFQLRVGKTCSSPWLIFFRTPIGARSNNLNLHDAPPHFLRFRRRTGTTSH